MSAPDTLLGIARDWLHASTPAMEVLVRDAKGSVPRAAGTRMLVSANQVAGTIGGGHLEHKAIAHARARLAAAADAVDAVDGRREHERQHDDRHYPLGPALGQCCGGALTLRTQSLTLAGLTDWTVEPSLFTLQLYGAGHVGRAIIHLLAGLNCRVQWIDEREAEFPSAASPGHIERLCVEPVEAEVAAAAAGGYFLVLTHSHDLDLRITEAILRRADFAYLGLIGSATKLARFRHRFEQRGIDAANLARITCPIGVPGISGKEPEVIALAVVAQLLQVAARAVSAASAVGPLAGS